MKTKLTLSLEKRLIERAKTYARERGTSVSQMVADYFKLLDVPPARTEVEAEADVLLPEDYEPTEFTKSLIGAFGEAQPGIDYVREYHRYLEEKHR